MSIKKKTLVTAFEAFAGRNSNPALEVLKKLATETIAREKHSGAIPPSLPLSVLVKAAEAAINAIN
ncbi:MAG: hypothetical protein A2234_04270 [Elusimicrobia bacterium RIFOXYA2_FULL_58_8]|nr:MAG: hypothetical protein A2285_01085 [Elusimicrobia bacterium RIFOXYA12_FULL_57_11]OGS16336.1 MAG: hypothetical protein A2234_04270 [Elusimicrobia bacterium RIFOXYA2_FULL_58_8]